jgi:hypothetical protein
MVGSVNQTRRSQRIIGDGRRPHGNQSPPYPRRIWLEFPAKRQGTFPHTGPGEGSLSNYGVTVIPDYRNGARTSAHGAALAPCSAFGHILAVATLGFRTR